MISCFFGEFFFHLVVSWKGFLIICWTCIMEEYTVVTVEMHKKLEWERSKSSATLT